MISADLQKAIDSLRIQDVYVREQVAFCAEGFDPKHDAAMERYAIQEMYAVKGSEVANLGDEETLLRVFVRLGARWVDPDEDDEASSVRSVIEAEFVAEYEMDEMLKQSSVDEFAQKNSSFHIWPYWRELLSGQCARMHLPRLILPAVQLVHHRTVPDE